MTLEMILGILAILVWITLSEFFYIKRCKKATREEIKENWLDWKYDSFMLGIILIAFAVICLLMFALVVTIIYTFPVYSLIVVLILAMIVLFFWLNYKLGMRVSNG